MPENFIFFTFGFKEMLFHVFLPFLQKNEKMQIILISSDERHDEMAQISHSRFHWFSQVKLRVTLFLKSAGFIVSPAKHSDTYGSLRPSVTLQSYVLQATHAFLGMLPLFFVKSVLLSDKNFKCLTEMN